MKKDRGYLKVTHSAKNCSQKGAAVWKDNGVEKMAKNLK